MSDFRLDNNVRFFNKCIEEGTYPKDVMEATIEHLDLLDYEVVMMGNGSFIDVYDNNDNAFLGITTKRDIIDYAIESKENWLDTNSGNLNDAVANYHTDRLKLMKDFK